MTSFTRRHSLVLAIEIMILIASAITLGIGVEETSATKASILVRPDLASLAKKTKTMNIYSVLMSEKAKYQTNGT